MFVRSYEEALPLVLSWALSFNRKASPPTAETPLLSLTVRVEDKERLAFSDTVTAVGLFHAHCQLGHQLELEQRIDAEERLPPTGAIVTLGDLARYHVAADAVFAAALANLGGGPPDLDPKSRLDPSWRIGVARSGDADVWVVAGLSFSYFALLEGHAGQGWGSFFLREMGRVLDPASAPVHRGASPSELIQHVEKSVQPLFHGESRKFSSSTAAWGVMACVRSSGEELSIAHVGDSRSYRVSARGLERITTEQTVAALVASGAVPKDLGVGHFVTSSICGMPAQIEAQSLTVAIDDTVVLCSSRVWRAAGIEKTLELAHLEPDPHSAARLILERSEQAAASCAVVAVARFRGPSKSPNLEP